MHLSLSDEILAGFLGGLISVFAILGIGALIYLILINLKKCYPFLRLSIALSLAPLTMVNFIERNAIGQLYLYMTAVMLIGLALDGTNYLLHSRSKKNEPPETDAEAKDSSTDAKGLAWDRAAK